MYVKANGYQKAGGKFGPGQTTKVINGLLLGDRDYFFWAMDSNGHHTDGSAGFWVNMGGLFHSYTCFG